MRDARRPTALSVILVAAIVACLLLALDPAHADERRLRAHRGVAPERLVKPDGTPIANGCGPGWASWQDGFSWRLANRHAYDEGGYGRCESLAPSDPDSCNGRTWTYEVDFRDACNLHDAGYQGRLGVMVDGRWVEQRLVYDKILDIDVDYSTWSRQQVDERFYQDMLASCEQQIVPQEGQAPFAERAWRRALDACKHRGQGLSVGASWGAETLYIFVRGHGHQWFNDLGPGGHRGNDEPKPGRW
jgi:hypothetical protein